MTNILIFSGIWKLKISIAPRELHRQLNGSMTGDDIGGTLKLWRVAID
jgi:hypothetical protein